MARVADASGAAGSAAADRVVGVAVLGCGNVGSALASLLVSDAEGIQARSGVALTLVGVAVADLAKDRPGVPASLLTDDAMALVKDPAVEVVVELIGGIEPARSLIESALAAGKPVVTANKELLAATGTELSTKAAEAGVDLFFEAAVAGAIPIIRPLRESLAAEEVQRVMGIVNGTTNFILTRMSEGGLAYAEAVTEAQDLGYAERDPSADVDGHDAAAKAAILASLAFRSDIRADDVPRQGISTVSAVDIAFASKLGYVVKLLAVAERIGIASEPGSQAAAEVSVRVHPAMLPRTHPLAAVRGAFNAVFVEGASAGELMLYGRGAGGVPTASAVLGDLVDAVHHLGSGFAARPVPRTGVRMHPAEDLRCAWYLNIDVADKPGVLASVAKVFGDNNVSIRSMEQLGLGDEARLVFLTHVARQGDVMATIEHLRQLDVVDHIGGVLRVIGEQEQP